MAKTINMSLNELSRYDIINDLINGRINGSEASLQLNLSLRHTKRLKSKVLNFGPQALAHASRGRAGNRAIDPEIISKAEKFLKSIYPDFKPSLASEKLRDHHSIFLGREKVRQLMINLKLWHPKLRKQPKNQHHWRARKNNFGEMQQFDGSYHFWLEDRAGELCLLVSIDDATGKITHAKFDYNESTIAVLKFWKEYFLKNNLPVSIYLDKFSTYKINHKSAVDNKDMITQFKRAMNQIGVNTICANSPQAKGRVERLFQTLQDRLVKEMRLANISTIEQANDFLKDYIPKFNERFSVVPARKADLHKKINKTLKKKLPQILSIQHKRKINNDYTVMFKTKFFQLDQLQPTTVYKKDSVIVEEHLNGEIKINFKGHYLKYTELPKRPEKVINIKLPALIKKKQSDWKPPANHPWRKQLLFNHKPTAKKFNHLAFSKLSN